MGLLDLLDLPTDLFLMVTRYLDPIDIVRCRLVSKSWHKEFTDESFLRDVAVRDYGGSQDVRALSDLELKYMVPSGSDFEQFQGIWRRTFDRVSARKRALKSGRPQHVTKRHLHHGPRHPWRSNRIFKATMFRFIRGADILGRLTSTDVVM